MRTLHCLPLLLLLAFSPRLCADQVVLQNGDRLTGIIAKSDGTTLLIKTEFAGDVTVQWPAIQQITSTQPLHVATQGGKTVVGSVTTADGTLAINTPAAGTVNVPKAEVTALRSDSEQAAYEKSLHPTLWQGWTVGSNVGFALTRGNSQSKSLALAFTGDRKTSNDRIALYTNTVYATNDLSTAVPHVTANATQGGARYERNFTKRLFGFGSADFQTDALQMLNLRSVFGGGLGFHLINTSGTTLDFFSGANYTRENYVASDRNFAALTLGEELMHKLGASTVLTEKLYFFPDLNQTGNYRATFNFGTITKISKWLGWQNAFGDIYVTNPPADPTTGLRPKQNDIQLTTGLNVTFTH